MSDSARGRASSGPAGATRAGSSSPVATLERVCFLEWRIEQLSCALEDKDRLLQQQRVDLAESAQREADAAGRVGELERLLAEARREAVLLGDRCALQGDLEERLGDSEKVHLHAARLLRDLERERERVGGLQRALERARERTTILEAGRERFFAKLIQWQSLGSNQESSDLAQFIAELRAEVARLASENLTLAGREAELMREVEALRAVDDGHEARPAPLPAAVSAIAVRRKGSPGSERGPAVERTVAEREASPEVQASARSARVMAAEPVSAGGGESWPEPVRAGTPPPDEERDIEAPSADAPAGAPLDLEAVPVPVRSATDGSAGDPTLPGEAAGSRERSQHATAADVPPADAPDEPPLRFAEVRAQLAATLGGTARARNAERLLFELFGPNAALRRGAARALYHLAGVHAAPALTLAFHTATDAEECVELLQLMARSGSPGVRSVIEAAQRASSAAVRAAALDALALHARRDPDALRDPIERALGDPESRVRRRAVMVLCSLPRFDATALLSGVLDDPDPQIRRAACVGLAQMQTSGVQRLLATALLDPELAVRKAAAHALEPGFGEHVARIPERSEADRRRSVAALRERIAARDEEARRPSATRLFDLGLARRPSERGVRSGSGHRRPVRAAGAPAGASE